MKLLLWFAIAGFSAWAVSDILEALSGGRTPTVYYLTSVYHALAAVGVWGIHRAQSETGLNLSTIATVMQSVGLAIVVLLPLQLMRSGMEPSEFAIQNPHFIAGGLLNVLGMVALGAAIWRCGVFPRWTGVAIPIGAVLFITLGVANAGLIANIANVLLAAIFVYLAVLGLGARHASA
ncbi:MAG: hypothetical protein V2I27_02935 [Erythrobacter sp.]|jgi:hypothetical protein|nr:hypothetical protein [Erythrobacter sp.]